MGINVKKIFFLIIFLLLSVNNSYPKNSKVDVWLFYSPHCSACIKLKSEFIPEFLKEYKNKVILHSLDITDKKNLEKLVNLGHKIGIENTVVPSVLIGNHLLSGRKNIIEKLGLLVEDAISNPIKKNNNFFQAQTIANLFSKLSFFTIIIAGLLDGINPCAFAVIIFFISFLTTYGYSRRQMLVVGASYILSVFIMYVLIGLGIFHFLYLMRYFPLIMKIFYYAIAVFCLLLAIGSFYDWYIYHKKKETSEMVLQLPKFLKKRISLTIGEHMRTKKKANIFILVVTSFFVGMLVSLLEAACTGQVYLPVISVILKESIKNIRAWLYLISYNLMFILPLVIIFLMAFLGCSSSKFQEILKKNLGLIKLGLGFLFLLFALLMFWQNIGL